jgi:hypothetical protein
MKNQKWLLGLIGLLLAGGLFITACDDGSGNGGNGDTGNTLIYGTLYAYNNSIYRTADANITMTIFRGSSSIVGPRTIAIDTRWVVTEVPAGVTYTLKVVDGYSYSYTQDFTVTGGGSCTLRFNGSGITQD